MTRVTRPKSAQAKGGTRPEFSCLAFTTVEGYLPVGIVLERFRRTRGGGTDLA